MADHPGKKCGKLAHDAGIFAEHLRQRHRGTVRSEGDVSYHCEMMHLRANAHNCFWCGFCNNLIRQDRTEIQNALGGSLQAHWRSL